MMEHHLGFNHLATFRAYMPDVVSALAPGFRAVELGAGMGWHAASLAGCGARLVVATDVCWKEKNPRHIENIHSFHRLGAREPRLLDVARISRDARGHLDGVEFAPSLAFVHADGARLPLPDQGVDLVYSFNVLEHLPDPAATFAEAARVLRTGGLHFGLTEMLYFSRFGHHLGEFFPVPWGHLLWTAEELADLAVRECPGREWGPGVALSSPTLRDVLTNQLNFMSPRAMRDALRAGPWVVRAWSDLIDHEGIRVAREIGLPDLLGGIPFEALHLYGTAFRLAKDPNPRGLRAPLRFGWPVRAWKRRILG